MLDALTADTYYATQRGANGAMMTLQNQIQHTRRAYRHVLKLAQQELAIDSPDTAGDLCRLACELNEMDAAFAPGYAVARIEAIMEREAFRYRTQAMCAVMAED